MRKKVFSVRFSLRNEKKKRQEHICFPYKYIAQMVSSRPRKYLFTERSTYRGIRQLTDLLIDHQCQGALVQNFVPTSQLSNWLYCLRSRGRYTMLRFRSIFSTLIFFYKNVLFFSEPQCSYFLPILSLKMFLACSYFFQLPASYLTRFLYSTLKLKQKRPNQGPNSTKLLTSIS